ncbi:uncharacterized protein [Ptychodera flava]|uniref:uncharacterized protein n=1 Tax=Ptychodera flava TaxID=63121 RepID=UPI003969C2E4
MAAMENKSVADIASTSQTSSGTDIIPVVSAGKAKGKMQKPKTADGGTAAILEMLQNISRNQTLQDSKITALCERVDNMQEAFEYVEEGDNSQQVESPAKKQKTSDASESNLNDTGAGTSSGGDKSTDPGLFKDFSDKFIVKEKCDEAVDASLAEIINGLFRQGISDEKMEELLKKHNRPDNCEGLMKVRVNQLVWDIIRADTRSMDSKFQTVQAALVKGSAILVKMVDLLAKTVKYGAKSENVGSWY